jgi:hypothetical protein
MAGRRTVRRVWCLYKRLWELWLEAHLTLQRFSLSVSKGWFLVYVLFGSVRYFERYFHIVTSCQSYVYMLFGTERWCLSIRRFVHILLSAITELNPITFGVGTLCHKFSRNLSFVSCGSDWPLLEDKVGIPCEISSSHGGEYDVQSCLHSSLMMEEVRTSETSVDNHFTRQYNPEDSSEH